MSEDPTSSQLPDAHTDVYKDQLDCGSNLASKDDAAPSGLDNDAPPFVDAADTLGDFQYSPCY
jgi:hypothetical protein